MPAVMLLFHRRMSPNARQCVVHMWEKNGLVDHSGLYIHLSNGYFPISSPPYTQCIQTNFFFFIKPTNFSAFPVLVGGTSIFQCRGQSERPGVGLLFLPTEHTSLTRPVIKSSWFYFQNVFQIHPPWLMATNLTDINSVAIKQSFLLLFSPLFLSMEF